MSVPSALDTEAFKKRVKLKFSENALRDLIRRGDRGAKVTYHIGFLCIDAEVDSEVRSVQKTVLEFASLGLVRLMQRKLAAYSYEYYVVVT